MSVKIFHNNKPCSLNNIRIYNNNKWKAVSDTDKIFISNTWKYIGNVISGASFSSGVHLTKTNHIYLQPQLASGCTLYLTQGTTLRNKLGTGDVKFADHYTSYTSKKDNYTYQITCSYTRLGAAIISKNISTAINSSDSGIRYESPQPGSLPYVERYSSVSNFDLGGTGTMQIYRGGIASNITAGASGSLTIYSGGTANTVSANADYNSFGIVINSGGVINNLYMGTGGSLTIASGGTATNIIVRWSKLRVTLSDKTLVEGSKLVSDLNGDVFSSITLSNTISNFNIRGGQSILVGETCRAVDITVSPGNADAAGRHEDIGLAVLSGGFASNVYVSCSAYPYAATNAWHFYPGFLTVRSGAIIKNAEFQCPARAAVAGLAMDLAPDTYVDGSYTYNNTTSYFRLQKGILINFKAGYGTTINVLSGGTAFITDIFSGGYVTVLSGGTANSTVVNSSGAFYVSSGGTAIEITAYQRGRLNLEVAPDTYIQGTVFGASTSSAFEVSSGILSNYTITFNGSLIVSSGGTTNNINIIGGSITSTNTQYHPAYNGQLLVSSGGTANSTTVNFRGSMYIYSGGIASSIVENGGYVKVQDGATASFAPNVLSSLIVPGGIDVTIHSGTTANYTNISNQGDLYVYGGTANSTTINSGSMWIASGGTADSTTVNSLGYMNISSGGIADNTIVNSSGRLYVSRGGTANNTVIDSYGSMYIGHSGTATDITVKESSTLIIDSGGYYANISRYDSNTASVSINSGAINMLQ